MYCINCGFKRSLYDKFCKWCGPSKGCYMPYHIPGGDITWSECTLRVWLNSVFINKFFDKKEKTRMIQTNGLVSFYGRD